MKTGETPSASLQGGSLVYARLGKGESEGKLSATRKPEGGLGVVDGYGGGWSYLSVLCSFSIALAG